MTFSEIEGRLRSFFDRRPDDIAAVYLYGSVARGTATAASDVDVAILLLRDPPPTLDSLRLGLAADLERELGFAVDLVVLNTAPPDLVHRVLREGRLLVERDRSARIRFEVRARNEYWDVKPILDRYRKRAVAPGVARP